MDIISVLKGSVSIKIKIKPLINKVIDEVLEPALDKVVEDSKNPFDNMLKASVYPILEKEIKEKAGEQVDKLKAFIPASLADIIEIE